MRDGSFAETKRHFKDMIQQSLGVPHVLRIMLDLLAEKRLMKQSTQRGYFSRAI
jgi:hypothetical protein